MQAEANEPSPELRRIAQRVRWWAPAEAALADRLRFVARVMVFGTWEDTCRVRDTWGEGVFGEVLRQPPPGVFDARSWHYWHRRCGLPTPPAPPQRAL